MNGEITLTLNASADFTRKGYGAHVENIGGTFDRITKTDTTRGVTLPLTSAGMAMATQLVDKFPVARSVVVRGDVRGHKFRNEIASGVDMGAFAIETAFRLGVAQGEALEKGRVVQQQAEDARQASRLQVLKQDDADAWRTVALALARR